MTLAIADAGRADGTGSVGCGQHERHQVDLSFTAACGVLPVLCAVRMGMCGRCLASRCCGDDASVSMAGVSSGMHFMYGSVQLRVIAQRSGGFSAMTYDLRLNLWSS